MFVVFEGGEGAGKSTQVQLLAEWLRSTGRSVVVTREPGGTPLGHRLRQILLDVETGTVSPRAEALLYAADRAEHVERVVQPALRAGSVVVSDRYVDSSIAYQGAGRVLDPRDIARVSEWATQGLVPDLTVLLDVDPRLGLGRFDSPADRLEGEPLEFHIRVREGFLALAAQAPKRYLVVDAADPVDVVHAQVRAAVGERAA